MPEPRQPLAWFRHFFNELSYKNFPGFISNFQQVAPLWQVDGLLVGRYGNVGNNLPGHIVHGGVVAFGVVQNEAV